MTTCTSCSQPIPPSARSDAKFCSTACRMRAHRRNKRNEQPRPLGQPPDDMLADAIHPGLAAARRRLQSRRLWDDTILDRLPDCTSDDLTRIAEAVAGTFTGDDLSPEEQDERAAVLAVVMGDGLEAREAAFWDAVGKRRHVPAVAAAVADVVRRKDPVGLAITVVGLGLFELPHILYRDRGALRLAALQALLTWPYLNAKQRAAVKNDVATLESAPYRQYSAKVAKLVVTFRNIEPLKAMLLDAIAAYGS